MHALDEGCDALKREFDLACSRAARAARCQITNELNQTLRRLRQYQTEGEWFSAVLDAASLFVQQIAVFAFSDGVLTLRGQCKLKLPETLSFPVVSAAAFAGAIETKDPVVAMRTRAEVTDALSLPEVDERAYIFPITNGSRTVAVLFAAAQDYMDANALELITGIASTVLERSSNNSLHAQIAASPPVAKSEAAAGN